MIYGCSLATVETDFETRLNADNPVRLSNEAFREHFTGTQLVDLYIDTPEAGGLLDPAFLRGLEQLDARLEDHPGVDEALSLGALAGSRGTKEDQVHPRVPLRPLRIRVPPAPPPMRPS